LLDAAGTGGIAAALKGGFGAAGLHFFAAAALDLVQQALAGEAAIP
jgi:hypothetical protein